MRKSEIAIGYFLMLILMKESVKGVFSLMTCWSQIVFRLRTFPKQRTLIESSSTILQNKRSSGVPRPRLLRRSSLNKFTRRNKSFFLCDFLKARGCCFIYVKREKILHFICMSSLLFFVSPFITWRCLSFP